MRSTLTENNVSLDHWLLRVSVFSAPFASVGLAGVNFTVSDLFFSLLFVRIFMMRSPDTVKLSKRKSLVAWLMVGWWMIAVGYLSSALIRSATSLSETLILLAQFGFALLVIPYVLTRLDVDYLDVLRWFVIGLATSIAIGYLLQTFAPEFSTSLSDTDVILGGPRRFGAFLGSNALGKVIATTIPIIFLLRVTGRVRNLTMAVILLVFLGGTLLAASNAGALLSAVALLACIAIVFLTTGAKSVKIGVLLSIGGVSLLLLRTGWFTTDTFRDRVATPLMDGELDQVGSYSLKADLMETAWELIGDSPLFGLGAGGFADPHGGGITVHNSYLLSWVEGGLVALVGLVIVFAAIGMPIMSCLRVEDRIVVLFAIVSIGIMLVGLWTGNQPYQRYRFLPLIAMSLYFSQIFVVSQHKFRESR